MCMIYPHTQGYMLDIFGWKPSEGYYTMWVLGIDWLAAMTAKQSHTDGCGTQNWYKAWPAINMWLAILNIGWGYLRSSAFWWAAMHCGFMWLVESPKYCLPLKLCKGLWNSLLSAVMAFLPKCWCQVNYDKIMKMHRNLTMWLSCSKS